MRLRLLTALLAGTTATIGFGAHAETTQLNVGQTLARADLLKPGVHRYLRYTVKDGQRATRDIWSRQVAYEQVDGKRQLRITQRWDAVGEKPSLRLQDSRFEAGTFRPLMHIDEATREGKTRKSGYRYSGNDVIGIADMPDNDKKDFTATSSEPAYNFETDIEFLQTLPLAAGYTVSIPFYDPGLSPAARYVFKVAGQGQVAGADGRPIDCWIVTTDYNRPGYESRFWFAKQSQVMIRQESPMPDGGLLVKTLLPPEAGDSAGPG